MRCDERNKWRNRCLLDEDHDGPCQFRRTGKVEPCPTCQKIHRGPRCLPENERREYLTVSIPVDLLDRFDEKAYGTFDSHKARSLAAVEAFEMWLAPPHPRSRTVSWRTEDCP